MKNLSLLRKESGISQIELAEKLEVSQQTISKYENGTREPDNATLFKLSEIFKCSIDYLLGKTNQRNQTFEDEASIVAHEIIKVDPELFTEMCRAKDLPAEDRQKVKEYAAMLIEKRLREQREKHDKNIK